MGVDVRGESSDRREQRRNGVLPSGGRAVPVGGEDDGDGTALPAGEAAESVEDGSGVGFGDDRGRRRPAPVPAEVPVLVAAQRGPAAARGGRQRLAAARMSTPPIRGVFSHLGPPIEGGAM